METEVRDEGNEMEKEQKPMRILYVGHCFGQHGLDLATSCEKHAK